MLLPGRLLRANQISFNWDRLASWINLTEQWPYRTSWLILYLEETEGVPDQMTLKAIYERYFHLFIFNFVLGRVYLQNKVSAFKAK